MNVFEFVKNDKKYRISQNIIGAIKLTRNKKYSIIVML